VVERNASLVEEALLSHLGRHGPQAHLAALGPLARQTLRQGNSIRARLGEALAALALAGRLTLPLPSGRQLGNGRRLLELRDGPEA